jgi:hypothetical protein
MTGYVKMSRGWLDDEMFQDAPYSERDAWAWMIGEARYEEGKVSVAGRPMPIKRGQFYASIRFMAEKFQWSTNRVMRFLKRLEEWGAVKTATETGQTLVTICNYSKYQDNGNTSGDTSENRGEDTGGDTPEDKQEEIQEIQEKDITPKKISNSGKRTKAQVAIQPEGVSDAVWDDFLTHRNKMRAPVTQTALDGIRREAERAGWSLNSALQECCARGWRGFEAEWLKGKADPHAAPAAGTGALAAPIPDWQKPLLAHMPETDVRGWFNGVRMEENRLIFPTKFAADWVKQRLDQQVRRVFGQVDIVVEASR